MASMETFGERLKRLRLARGLSVNKFAREVGRDPGSISRIENGKRLVDSTPPAHEIQKWAEVLGVLEMVLVRGDGTAHILETKRSDPPAFITQPLPELLSKLGAIPVGDTETRMVQAVSAGKGRSVYENFGEYLPDEDLFLVEVVGDCMVPEIHSGDRVKFDPNLEPENGDWVVATIDGENAIVKSYELKGAVQRLLPLNGEPLIIDENIRIVGVVLWKESPGPRGRRKVRRKKEPRTSWE